MGRLAMYAAGVAVMFLWGWGDRRIHGPMPGWGGAGLAFAGMVALAVLALGVGRARIPRSGDGRAEGIAENFLTVLFAGAMALLILVLSAPVEFLSRRPSGGTGWALIASAWHGLAAGTIVLCAGLLRSRTPGR